MLSIRVTKDLCHRWRLAAEVLKATCDAAYPAARRSFRGAADASHILSNDAASAIAEEEACALVARLTSSGRRRLLQQVVAAEARQNNNAAEQLDPTYLASLFRQVDIDGSRRLDRHSAEVFLLLLCAALLPIKAGLVAQVGAASRNCGRQGTDGKAGIHIRRQCLCEPTGLRPGQCAALCWFWHGVY